MSDSNGALRSAVVAGVLCLFGGVAASGPPAPYPTPANADRGDGGPHVVFTIRSRLITESSALAVSTAHRGLIYTANDSGDGATIYVLDAADGRLVGQTSLAGVSTVDVEALAIGADGTLLMGDIGDNHSQRDAVFVYRLPQPDRGRASVRPDAVRLTYVDGPRDAESLLYDAGTGRIFVASKRLGGAKVYVSRPDAFARTAVRMTPKADAPAIATDATFIDGERYVVIRTYVGAVVCRFPSWRRIASFDLPPQPQGESVAAPAGGTTLLIGSEGVDSKVLRVSLPDLDRAGPSRHTTSSSGSPAAATRTDTVFVESPARRSMRSIAVRVIEVAGVALVLVAVAAVVLYRRHRHER